VQIQRAIALGLGARGAGEVELVSEDLGGGGRDFTVLVEAIRQHASLP
jgi:hypothetical protein